MEVVMLWGVVFGVGGEFEMFGLNCVVLVVLYDELFVVGGNLVVLWL